VAYLKIFFRPLHGEGEKIHEKSENQTWCLWNTLRCTKLLGVWLFNGAVSTTEVICL